MKLCDLSISANKQNSVKLHFFDRILAFHPLPTAKNS